MLQQTLLSHVMLIHPVQFHNRIKVKVNVLSVN